MPIGAGTTTDAERRSRRRKGARWNGEEMARSGRSRGHRAYVGVSRVGRRESQMNLNRGRHSKLGFAAEVALDASWPTMTIYPASTRAQYASMVRFHAGRARHRSRYDAIPG